MLRDLMQAWWLLHIRGILTVVFGAFLLFLAGTMQELFTTAIALVGVMLVFVFYLIASGAVSIVAAFKIFGARERFWAVVLHGSILLALGFWLFFSNQMTAMWLVWFTVANALGSGLLEIILARATRGRALTVSVRGSRYSDFDPDAWWQSRTGVRTEIIESEKLLADIVLHPLS